MESKEVKKVGLRGGISYEKGDFHGAGNDEVIISLDEEGDQITINTSRSIYHHSLRPGDWVSYEDGSFRNIVSKYDRDETK